MRLRVFPALLLAALPAAAQDLGSQVPTPVAAIKRACDAAGGLAAFTRLGILEADVAREEVTQEGKVTSSRTTFAFLSPGPIPGRIEDYQHKVLAGDDGSGGWALVDRKVDVRPATVVMVKRMLASELFPLMLPFSLTWDGATVSDVAAAQVNGRPVWRLSVAVTRSFFHSPQISTSWTVDFDQASWLLVGAEAPATDLGNGIKADGMRFTWSDPVTVGGVALRATQRVIGLDELGREKAHNRVDRVGYKLHPAASAEKLFANPIPPEARPTRPGARPPEGTRPPQP